MPPLPKKRSERRRRNIVPGETVTSVVGELSVAQPPLTAGQYFSPGAQDWYRSLSKSGQALSYEPSDWQLAIQVASWITDYDIAVKPAVSLLRYILDGMRQLLVSEDARRRAHLELERGTPSEELPADVAAIEDYRSRLRP